MTLFWILVGTLIVLAVLVVIWPLLPFNVNKLTAVELGQSSKNVEIFKQRLAELEEDVTQGKLSVDEWESMKRELEKTVLVEVVEEQSPSALVQVSTGSWLIAGVLSLLVAGTSLGLYAHFGQGANLAAYLARDEQASQQQTSAGHTQEQNGRMNLAEAVVGLEEKLANNPGDKRGWSLLALTYRQLGSVRKSADAFKHLVDLMAKDDPDYAAMLGSYAQSLYIAEGEKTTPDVQKVMDEALQIDPLEPTVLSLAGAELFARNDFEGAVQQWQKALQKADKAQVEQYLQPAIAVARERLGLAADAAPVAANSARQSEGSTPGVVGPQEGIALRVDIAAELKSKTHAEQVVFIFARPVGGRMPAAVKRLQVKDLPIEITLTDAMSPMPTARLSLLEEVEITARVSSSGQLMAQPGDLFVTHSPVSVKGQTEPLELMIDQTVN